MKNSFAHIKNTVKSFLESNCKDKESRHFLLGVSGGADSVLLAHVFHSLNLKFSIAHINYNLRGNESNADEKFVRLLAKKLKVAVYVKNSQTKSLKKNKESIQMLARAIRYDFFEEVKQKYKTDLLVLGHHANDQIETVLLNMFRGSGIEGLGGMREVNGTTIRPLLNISRKEIEKALQEKKLDYRTDSSNLKDDYKRNYLRNTVIPVIEKRWPGFEKTMLKNIELYAEVKEVVNEKENTFDFSRSFQISISQINQSKTILNAFKKACSKNGFNLAGVSNLLSEKGGNESKIIKTKTGSLECKNGNLFFVLYSTNKNTEPQITQSKNKLSISGLDPSFLKTKTEKISLKKVSGTIHLKRWLAGDRMIPLGMTGSKKISDLLTDLKLTAGQKREVFVLWDDKKPLWLVGFRIDNRVKLDGNEPKNTVLTLSLV